MSNEATTPWLFSQTAQLCGDYVMKNELRIPFEKKTTSIHDTGKVTTPHPKTTMTLENPPGMKMYVPLQNGDFPMTC